MATLTPEQAVEHDLYDMRQRLGRIEADGEKQLEAVASLCEHLVGFGETLNAMRNHLNNRLVDQQRIETKLDDLLTAVNEVMDDDAEFDIVFVDTQPLDIPNLVCTCGSLAGCELHPKLN